MVVSHADNNVDIQNLMIHCARQTSEALRLRAEIFQCVEKSIERSWSKQQPLVTKVAFAAKPFPLMAEALACYQRSGRRCWL